MSGSVRVVLDSWQQRLSLKECSMRRKVGRFEQLERRSLLAGCALPWLDVDNDGFVAPRDALIVINDLNGVRGAHPFEALESGNNEWLDVNFDRWVSPIDALLIINDLNANGSHPFVLVCPTGSLFVTSNPVLTPPQYVLGGTLEQSILSVHLFAQGEDVDVYRMYFSLSGDVRSVDRLELYEAGATNPFAVATIANVGADPVPAGFTTFAANMRNGEVIVPEGHDVDIIVRPRMKSDRDGAISGENVKVSLVVDDGFQPVLARGVSTSNNLSSNNGDAVVDGEVFVGVDTAGPNAAIVGRSSTVVLSKIDSVQNANPDADGSAVPTGMSSFSQFKLTAAANTNFLNGPNKAVIDSFVVIVTAENVALDASAFRIYNKADATVKVSAIAESLTGAPLTGAVTGDFRIRVTGLAASAVDTVLGSGESDTLVLEGSILNAHVNPARPSVLQGHLDLTDTFFTWFDRDNGGSTLQRGAGRAFVSSTRYSG